jgi:L-alanine-DL-glutamate epimerase-like enolase superfamily enzyme
MWQVYENPPTMDKATGIVRLSDRPGLGMTYKADLIQDV